MAFLAISGLPGFFSPMPVGLCRNPRSDFDVMLSKAKHLAFSSGYEVEILRLSPQNDIMKQSQ
jgi:hypothetical protein